VEPSSVTTGALAAAPDEVTPAPAKKKRARKPTSDATPSPPSAADEPRQHKTRKRSAESEPEVAVEADPPQPTAAEPRHVKKRPDKAPAEDMDEPPPSAADEPHKPKPRKRRAEPTPAEDGSSVGANDRARDEAVEPHPKSKHHVASNTDRDPPLMAADDSEHPAKKKSSASASKRAANKHAAKTRREREPSPEYRKLRDSWHAPLADAVEPTPIIDEQGRPPLVIVPVNGGEQVTLTPDRDDGGFDDEDLSLAARAFTPGKLQKPHPVAPHLLDLVYQTMRHFAAPFVRMVSGYRQDRAGSRHTQGRAIDMVIPGVSNEELVDYVRQFGFCGVGIYPKSGFVHLDVRESSFFWVDETLPDERSKGLPVAGDEAKEADLQARERGEGPQTFVPDNDKEDRAAARSYARRAKRRAAAAPTQHASMAE
ncbi:MAG TPA: DUF882 domain-containing protein, partial [Polyangiales bacterium]|nr:DUF882 domain-containing protein [Polyangiales bacterium]